MNAIINAVIVDDEAHNRENIRALLQMHCPEVRVLGEADTAITAKTQIESLRPDLILLDIQMPGGNGFDLLRQLTLPIPELIFITAYDQFAIQAFRFSAVDYLLKPVHPEELKGAIGKARERMAGKQQNRQLENLLQLLHQQKKEDHRIALPTQKEIRFVSVRELVYCESSNNYTTVFLQNGEKILVSKPIFEYEEMLTPYRFIRCHQRFLVNVAFVRSFIKEDGGFLLLEGNYQIPVSRQKKELVRQAITG